MEECVVVNGDVTAGTGGGDGGRGGHTKQIHIEADHLTINEPQQSRVCVFTGRVAMDSVVARGPIAGLVKL